MAAAIFASAALVLLVDQATKHLAWATRADVEVLGPLRVRVRLVIAPGAARWPLAALLVVTVGAVIATVAYGPLFQHVVARIGLGVAIGGAIGNVVDRLRRGAVVDFIDLGWWPVFNIADASITLGVVAAICFMR